jgi:hypothetical protein
MSHLKAVKDFHQQTNKQDEPLSIPPYGRKGTAVKPLLGEENVCITLFSGERDSRH